MMIKFRTIIKKSNKKKYIYVLNCFITLGHHTIVCARTQYFPIGFYPQSNFFCQPGVVALAGSLSCYQKSNILNYLIGNVAGKYLVFFKTE